jgi:hypothetical protein
MLRVPRCCRRAVAPDRSALRPHLRIAGAVEALGRTGQVVEHGTRDYRWAWADGPDHCRFWALRRATGLLDRLGAEPPEDTAAPRPG